MCSKATAANLVQPTLTHRIWLFYILMLKMGILRMLSLFKRISKVYKYSHFTAYNFTAVQIHILWMASSSYLCWEVNLCIKADQYSTGLMPFPMYLYKGSYHGSLDWIILQNLYIFRRTSVTGNHSFFNQNFQMEHLFF